MNENYLSGKCICIYISVKYISKDVDAYYPLKKIYSSHVPKIVNNLSRDACFSDLYVKSVSKLLRCHRQVWMYLESTTLLSAVLPGLGWSAASWL